MFSFMFSDKGFETQQTEVQAWLFHKITSCVCVTFATSLFLNYTERWKWKCHSLSHVWLCVPMDSRPPGFSVHGIFQVRILERVAISFLWDLPDPGIEPRITCITGRLLTIWAIRKAHVKGWVTSKIMRIITRIKIWGNLFPAKESIQVYY